MIQRKFRYPKDPASTAHYLIGFGEPITAVLSCDVEVSGPAQESIGYPTPGDELLGSDLTATDAAVTTQDFVVTGAPQVPAGQGVTVLLAGGKPGAAYAVRLGVQTLAGDTLYASVILDVTGL